MPLPCENVLSALLFKVQIRRCCQDVSFCGKSFTDASSLENPKALSYASVNFSSIFQSCGLSLLKQRKWRCVWSISTALPDVKMIHQCSLSNSDYLQWAVKSDQTDYQMARSRSWNGICLAHFVLDCVTRRSRLDLQGLLEHLIAWIPMSWNCLVQEIA